MIKNNLLKEEYIIFDVETTGFCTIKNEIIEIGAIKIKNGIILEEFSKIINIKKYINPFITKLTGIDQQMINQGEEEKQVSIKFYDFIQGYHLVAHNSKFDIKFINALFDKHKIENINKENTTDSISIFKKIYCDEKSYSLSNLTKNQLSNNIIQNHRALDDCKLVLKLIKKI